MTKTSSYRSAFIIITILFFLWGFITVLVDSLIPRLRDIFELSYFQAGLVQFAFFLAYFVFSVPAGYLLSRIGYQRGIVLGLSIMAVSCLLFYPAASLRLFPVFLLAYFGLAAGITVLQVAANPYVAVLGDEKGASSRLNLSQAFNSLGTTIAPVVGTLFLLQDKILSSKEIMTLSESERETYFLAEASAVQKPFVFLAICIGILVLFFALAKLPKILEKAPEKGYITALKNKTVLLGVTGIFLYVGAEVAIGSFLVNYFLDMQLLPLIAENHLLRNLSEYVLGASIENSDPKAVMGSFVFLYWGGAMIGRFVGAYLTKIYTPTRVLVVFALLAVCMLFMSMTTHGITAMLSILSVGLFNSIMFPTIFTLTLEGTDNLKPQISGLLCMAIVGGAVIPPLYGFLTDVSGFKWALLLLIACYAFIFYFGIFKRKEQLTLLSK